MMIQEFEQLTGIEPTADEYSVIEGMYYEYNGDKGAFCKDFVDNHRMIEALRRANSDLQARLDQMHGCMDAARREISDAIKQINRLQAELEREQEWQPYEDRHNVSQADYEALNDSSSRRQLTDDDAADLIAGEFGFERARIRIVHSVPREEISRHRRIRTVGVYRRDPLFDAWDMNYIRFDVAGNVTMSYEMHNGELSMFQC